MWQDLEGDDKGKGDCWCTICYTMMHLCVARFMRRLKLVLWVPGDLSGRRVNKMVSCTRVRGEF